MLKMNWLNDGHVVSLNKALEAANELYWNMRVEQDENGWFVWAGDQTLLVTDNRESVDAFLYGLAMTYSILPDPAFAIVRKEVRNFYGDDLDKEW